MSGGQGDKLIEIFSKFKESQGRPRGTFSWS